MSYFVAGILRIIILEASAALLIMSRLVRSDDSRGQRRLDLAFRVVAVLALFSWTNFGALRGDAGLVHRWEQYHFFFGSKYLPELGYFNLYKATFLADRQTAHQLGYIQRTRDLTTFDEVPVETAMRDAAEVRARFSDARWAEFSADWQTLARDPANWRHIMADHGNSGSPAWAILAAPIARLVGIGPTGQRLMGLVDPLLMVVLLIFAMSTFGTRPGCVLVIIWSMLPFCFDMLAGSLLRWDWLFALGMCLCFWRRGKPLTAGAFLGYAVASKLFPLFFGVGLGLHAAFRLVRTHRLDRRLVRFTAGAALALLLSVVISSAMFGGLGVWRGYRQRIQVAQNEKYYPNQYSFRTVFLQWFESSPREIWYGWMAPADIKQARADVDLARRRVPFAIGQLALTALVAAALATTDELEALAIGPLLVYIWLMVNAYYWNMLALTAMVWTVREREGQPRLLPLVGLHALLIWFYVYQHLSHGFSEGYLVGLLLCGLCLAWGLTLVGSHWQRRRRAAALAPSPIR